MVDVTFASHIVATKPTELNGESECKSVKRGTKAKEKQGGKDSPLLPHHPVGVAT